MAKERFYYSNRYVFVAFNKDVPDFWKGAPELPTMNYEKLADFAGQLLVIKPDHLVRVKELVEFAKDNEAEACSACRNGKTCVLWCGVCYGSGLAARPVNFYGKKISRSLLGLALTGHPKTVKLARIGLFEKGILIYSKEWFASVASTREDPEPDLPCFPKRADESPQQGLI